MKRRVADIIMETLVEEGITECFGVVGGGAMHLDNALALNKDIHKVFNHHEQASAMAAEAYARYSGKMAAVCVTSGPGATNTLTGVMGSWQDSLPMIVLSGQVRYAISVPRSGLDLRYRGIQEYNIVPSVKHMTKYAVMLTDPLAVKRELVKAIQIAMDGRRGPVWLDVPQDIQNAMVEEEELYSVEEYVSEVEKLADDEINSIIKELQSAKRPCILAGSGIISGGARKKFAELVDALKVPVIGGAWVADNFYLEHELYFGNSGNIGPRTGNFILQNADVIMTFGNSLGFRQTGFNQDCFAPKAKIIMIDADENEAKKPGLRIEKFVKGTTSDVIDRILEIKPEINCSTEWIDYCKGLKSRFSSFEATENLDGKERVCSYQFWKVFQQYEEADSILALGNNTANTAKLQIGVQKPEQRVITNYTCGSMGYELPAAIGASIAAEKKVYCVTGDGSVMMNLQEIQTIVQNDLPINIVVFSNDGYNAIRQTSKNFFNGTYIGCTADTGVSFPKWENVASTFEYEYRICKNNDELPEAIEWLTSGKNRRFLEVLQRLDDPVTPKVMSRLDENGNMLTPSLEDMAPFLSQEEHDSLMLW